MTLIYPHKRSSERNGVRVFHDYAHHPAEIRAAMDCALRTPHKKLFVVFQCNSFTRARTLFTENVDCFRGADKVLVPDIYPGREKDDGSVHARDMVAGINAETSNAEYPQGRRDRKAAADAAAVSARLRKDQKIAAVRRASL